MVTRGAAAADATRSPTRPLIAVVAIVFVDLLGFGIVVPILPFYVRSFGVSDVFIGLLAASYSLMQFGSAPYLGRLSDERGRRPVLMLSVFGNAVAWTVFGLGAEFESLFGVGGALATLFLSRMVAGAMGGNIAAAQAYVADVTPPDRRAGALGVLGAAFGLGFVFGPALGALFASDPVVVAAEAVFPSFVPATRFSLPSFAAAGSSLVALAAAAVALPEPARTRTTAARSGLVADFRSALADADLRPLVVVFLVTSVAFSGVQVAFVPYVADVYGYAESEAGLLLTYVGALGVLNQGAVVPALSRRVGHRRLAVAGAALLSVALVGLPFAGPVGRAVLPSLSVLGPELLALLAVLAVLSTGNGLLSVGSSAMVSAAASDDRQGAAFGVTQGAGSLGRTVGPPAMTALYVLSVPAPFLLGGLLVVVTLVVLAGVGDEAVPGG